METGVPCIYIVYNYMFKSYYVVWKREGFDAIAKHIPLFKSYYVVWKQIWG